MEMGGILRTVILTLKQSGGPKYALKKGVLYVITVGWFGPIPGDNNKWNGTLYTKRGLARNNRCNLRPYTEVFSFLPPLN